MRGKPPGPAPLLQAAAHFTNHLLSCSDPNHFLVTTGLVTSPPCPPCIHLFQVQALPKQFPSSCAPHDGAHPPNLTQLATNNTHRPPKPRNKHYAAIAFFAPFSSRPHFAFRLTSASFFLYVGEALASSRAFI